MVVQLLEHLRYCRHTQLLDEISITTLCGLIKLIYLSAEGIPEIFYVKLLPCPVGFSLQSHLQGCHCDTVLDCDVISVTTCKLVDGIILHPANI